MSKNPYKVKRLVQFVIDGDKLKIWDDDGWFITWSEVLPLSELYSKISEYKEKYSDDEGVYYTIINYSEYPSEAKDLYSENSYRNFALTSYDMCYITRTALKEHWEHERPVRKQRIRLIQKGLF